MNEELRELAALAALGLIEPVDAARLAEAIADDPELAEELRLDQAAVTRLSMVGRSARPPDLADRLVALARATREGAEPTLQQPRRRAIWLRRLAPPVGAAVAAATIAVVATVWFTRDDSFGTPDARASIAAASGEPSVRGTVAVFGSRRSDGTLVIDMPSMTPAPPGHHYEVWVLRAGATNMDSIGTFAPSAPNSVHLELPLPGAGPYAALDISLEDDGGEAEHSGTSVAGATF